MSASIQAHGIQNTAIKNVVEDLEVNGIKDAKALERKDKSAVAKAGIKYIIANKHIYDLNLKSNCQFFKRKNGRKIFFFKELERKLC